MNYSKTLIVFAGLLLCTYTSFCDFIPPYKKYSTYVFSNGRMRERKPGTILDADMGRVRITGRVSRSLREARSEGIAGAKIETDYGDLNLSPSIYGGLSWNVEAKKHAVAIEVAQAIKVLRKCTMPAALPEDLIAINNLTIPSSQHLNKELQKAKYDIQQIIYEGDTFFREKSAKFKGVQSGSDATKIIDIIDDFKRKAAAWAQNERLIINDCGDSKDPVSKHLDTDWERRIRSESFNRDLYKVIDLCKNNNIKKAEKIFKKYDKCRHLIETNPKHQEYTHLQYTIYKHNMLNHWQNNNPEAAFQILRNYEKEYGNIKERSFRIRSYYSSLLIMYKQQLKSFHASSVTSATKTDQAVERKVSQHLQIMHHKARNTTKSIKRDAELWEKYDSTPQTMSRLKALKEQEKKQTFTAKHYELTQDGKKILQDLGLDQEAFPKSYGNQFHHALHSEFVSIVNKAGLMRSQASSPEMAEISENIATFSDVGTTFLKEGFILEAMYTADFCWAFMDCGIAAGEGAIEGVKNVGHSLGTPRETTYKLAKSISDAGYYLFKILETAIAEDDLMYRDPEEFERRWDYRIARMNDVTEALKYQWETVPQREKIKAASAFTVESLITQKLTFAAGKFISGAKNKAIEIAKKLKKGEKVAVLITAEGLPIEAKIADEAQSFFSKAKKNKHLNGNKNPAKSSGKLSGQSSEVPRFIKENKVPNDFETILKKNSKFKRTNKTYDGARIYEKDGLYYYRDQFHTGEGAHLEVFNKKGKHLGEADPLTGMLRPNTIDKKKYLEIK